jgi:hypothetical protein
MQLENGNDEILAVFRFRIDIDMALSKVVREGQYESKRANGVVV